MDGRLTVCLALAPWLLLAAACGGRGATSSFGTSAEPGEPAAQPLGCAADDDCPLATPFCVAFDRQGSMTGPGPTTRRCVAGCESDRDCGAGFRCAGRYEAFQEDEEDDRSFGLALSQGVCAPMPRYGAVRLGGACSTDEDCCEDAPLCVTAGPGRFCTRLCERDCPRGFRCRAAQVLRADRTATVGLCAPIR